MSDPIPIREYTSSEVTLDPPDRAHILDLVKESDSNERRLFEAVTPTTKEDTFVLKPGPFVGRIGLPSGRSIDIASRFPFKDTLELIRLSGYLPTRTDSFVVPSDTAPLLIDVLATSFLREVDRLVSFGLAKAYRRKRFERPPYPGRPDITRHISRFAARPDKLVTSASRITHDIDANQVLAKALDVLGRIRLTSGLSRDVARQLPSFARVGRPPIHPNSISRIPLDRLTFRYRDALGLAELILRGQSLGPRNSSKRGASIAFNMTKVWERAVEHWVRDSWDDAYEVSSQHRFDVTSSHPGYADVVVREDGRPVALYEAKYKVFDKKPDSDDIYQMVTYCIRLGLTEATLVYPAPAPQQKYEINDITVRTIGIDISNPDAEKAAFRTFSGV